MVLAEFPDPQNVAHSNAVAHKSWLRYLFHGLVDELPREANIADPPALAEQLALVAEGIYGSVQSLGATGPAKQGRACVEALIGCAVVPKETTRIAVVDGRGQSDPGPPLFVLLDRQQRRDALGLAQM